MTQTPGTEMGALLLAASLIAGGCAPAAPALGGDNGDASIQEEIDAEAPGAGSVEWVVVEGSAFIMGGADPPSLPPQSVVLPTFRLGRTEVTVAQYRRCVEAGSCAAPPVSVQIPHEDRYKVPIEHGGPLAQEQLCNYHVAGRDRHPVNCISWSEARAFAQWSHPCGRLPSEAEWEFVARADQGLQPLPWGTEEITCQRAIVFIQANQRYCLPVAGGSWPVCSRQSGNTQSGVCDMIGNVEEWVEDLWVLTYDCASLAEDARIRLRCTEDDRIPGDGSPWVTGNGSRFHDPGDDAPRSIRGGSWLHAAESAIGGWSHTSQTRSHLRAVERNLLVGFRVAADAADHPNCQAERLSEE